MKSEPLHFSPTSAGVRIDHLNLHQSCKNSSDSKSNNDNCCISTKNNQNFNGAQFSLPRARVQSSSNTSTSTSKDEYEQRQFLCLEQILIQNDSAEKPEKTAKSSYHPSRHRHKPNNKMRNCLVVAGIAIVLSLLSFVFLVECRSVKGSPQSKKHYDAEVSSESRIQDASLQEPDSESSEEYSTKVVPTISASEDTSAPSHSTPVSSLTKSSTTTKRTSGSNPTSRGRLTRSRVSVICKNGYAGVLEEDLSGTSTSTFPSSSRKSQNKHNVNFPILLPRESDDEEDDEDGGEKSDWDDEDEGFSDEESIRQVITVTGYSQVAGGKPETKSLVKSGTNNAIKYVPKPSKKKASPAPEDESIETSSSEEVEVTSVKPKAKPSNHGHKHLKTKTHRNTPESASSKQTEAPKSSSSDKAKHRHNKRESSEEEDEEVPVTTPRAAKRSSKHSSKKSSSSSTTSEKNEKGDSGEIEEESLFPSLRSSNKGDKRAGDKGRKASERKQKSTTVIPLTAESELESAEAEPEAVISAPRKATSSSNKKSSRSRKSKGPADNENKKEASSNKTVNGKEDSSSEEFNMEEMPFPGHGSGNKKGKSRRSSSSSSTSSSSSSRSSKMSNKTVAPKQRTGTFSSIEVD